MRNLHMAGVRQKSSQFFKTKSGELIVIYEDVVVKSTNDYFSIAKVDERYYLFYNTPLFCTCVLLNGDMQGDVPCFYGACDEGLLRAPDVPYLQVTHVAEPLTSISCEDTKVALIDQMSQDILFMYEAQGAYFDDTAFDNIFDVRMQFFKICSEVHKMYDPQV